MKAFRGTLLAALVLVVVAIAFFLLRPDSVRPAAEETRLFTFEKHELSRVEVQRPDGTAVALSEQEGQWRIEGTDFIAGRSMVNRVKHQIHDLTARATVVEAPEAPELYGLGKNAVRVKLNLRDGRQLEFLAGDPNPSAVSYYIQPLPGETIYTVKKAAVDYYSLTLDEFRERRFASFDSKDVVGIEAQLKLPGAPESLRLERLGESEWQMHAPAEMAASDERVRRLMGRVSALKAQSFIELAQPIVPAALSEYGLDQPRADILLRFSADEPLRLKVGKDAPSDNRFEELAYMILEGDNTIYVARRGLLEEFGQDPAELRNRRVVRLKVEDIVSVDARLEQRPGEDLHGEHGVRYAAEQWVWKDGVPVPGSTPSRVAEAMAGLEVEEFVTDQPGPLSTYGLDAPIARVTLITQSGEQRSVLIGGAGPAREGPEGQDRERRYVIIEGQSPVYLVDRRILSVVEDLIREGNRKSQADLEKAARQERIPSTAAEPPK